MQAKATSAYAVLNLIMGMAQTGGAGGGSSLAGLQLLHLAAAPPPVATSAPRAATSAALRDAHVQLGHAASLDFCFNVPAREDGQLVSLVKAASTRHHTVLLLSTGVLVLCSADPAEHAQVVPFPGQAVREFAVLDVAAGDEHFAVCTDHGGVFTWGSDNTFGQLGNGTVWRAPHVTARRGAAAAASSITTPPVLLDPTELPGFGIKVGSPAQPSIVAVACGANHTLLLAASKTCVYAFGKGGAGQLGLSCPGGRQIDLSPVPKAIHSLFGVPLVSIHASGDHSLLLTQSGTLLAFGSNQTGAAGTGFVAKNAAAPTAAVFLTEDDTPAGDDTRRPAYESLPAIDSGRKPSDDPLFYPKRLLRYREPDAASVAVPVARVSTSASHTVALVDTQDSEIVHLYTSGLRELPKVPCSTGAATGKLPVAASTPLLFRADAVGAIGRSSVGEKNGAFVFRRTAAACVPPPSSAKHGGFVAAAGMRFTALLDPTAGSLFIIGNVLSLTGAVLVGTSEAALQTPAGAETVPTLSPLAVGGSDGKRRVVAACPARGGLLVLVEDKK